jgi:hypothetical protein
MEPNRSLGPWWSRDLLKNAPCTRSANFLTAVYGVIVHRDCANNLRLLAHEFVHVAQYERLGREGFLQEYIQQIAAHGYLNAPFESEAEAKATKACRNAGVLDAKLNPYRWIFCHHINKIRPSEILKRGRVTFD